MGFDRESKRPGKKSGAKNLPKLANELVKESVGVVEVRDASTGEVGEIESVVREFGHNPELKEFDKAVADVNSGSLVEIDGANNDLLMYLDWERGSTIEEISAKWKIPKAQVRVRVESAHASMIAEYDGENGQAALRASQDRELRRIRGMASREYNRSQGQRKVVTTRKGVVSEKLTDVEEIRQEESQPGDPRFLNVMLTATSDISRLWGVEAPKRVEQTVGGNVQVTVLHGQLTNAPEEVQDALAEGYWAMRRLIGGQVARIVDAECEVKSSVPAAK